MASESSSLLLFYYGCYYYTFAPWRARLWNSSNHCLLMWLWLRMGRQRAVNWDYGNGEMQSCHRYPHPTQVVCLLTERLPTPLIIDTDGRTSVAPTPPAPCRTIFKYNRVSKSLLSQMRRAWSGRHCSLDGILVKLSLWSLLTQDWATIDGWTAPAAPPAPLTSSPSTWGRTIETKCNRVYNLYYRYREASSIDDRERWNLKAANSLGLLA